MYVCMYVCKFEYNVCIHLFTYVCICICKYAKYERVNSKIGFHHTYIHTYHVFTIVNLNVMHLCMYVYVCITC